MTDASIEILIILRNYLKLGLIDTRVVCKMQEMQNETVSGDTAQNWFKHLRVMTSRLK